MYSNTKIVPFEMLLMLMLHQMDAREFFQKRIKIRAIGIRSTVSVIPVIAGI